jgi:hypothetical protein
MRQDPLQEIWTLQETEQKETVMKSIELILAQDEADREKQRRAHLWWTPLHLALLPLLFYCAATGKTPVVRAGYALMAAGIAVATSATWLFASWSRQALPGPMDTRSQLRKAAFLLSRQASLAKASALWAAPLFLGVALIGLWGYLERGHLLGYLVWGPVALLWIGVSYGGRKQAKAAEERKARVEELLGELS